MAMIPIRFSYRSTRITLQGIFRSSTVRHGDGHVLMYGPVAVEQGCMAGREKQSFRVCHLPPSITLTSIVLNIHETRRCDNELTL